MGLSSLEAGGAYGAITLAVKVPGARDNVMRPEGEHVQIGVDIGGTFTDIVALDDEGRLALAKVPSTPKDLLDGIGAAVGKVLALAGAPPGDVERFIHGTTVATNAVLEQKGAVTAVLTTEGFEDVLEMGRQKRSRMYDLEMDPETPSFLAPGRRRVGIRERLDARGAVLVPLDEGQVRAAVLTLRAQGVQAIAVCYLFSFVNPAHERRTRLRIARDGRDEQRRRRGAERCAAAGQRRIDRPVPRAHPDGGREHDRRRRRQLAWIDAAGGLRVGPRSAGAEPGPACYGRGGDEATVTDASVVLGYLNPARFAGGVMALDVAAAERAVAAIGQRLGVDRVAAAAVIHRVVNARIADQIRLVTIKRGYDPRQFSLVVLGGAGPVHGAALAAEMGMAEVLVPEAPGVLAAFGLLAAAIEHHHARTLQTRTDVADLGDVNACLADLDGARRARMRDEGAPAREVRGAYGADMRDVAPAYELEVPIAAPVAAERVPDIVAAFHAVHERVYGYARTQQTVEFVNFRAVHTYRLPRPVVRPSAQAHGRLDDARVGERRAYFDGFVSAAIYERARLPLGARLTGPAIVEQMDTTTVIPPGVTAVVDDAGNLRLRRA